MSDDPLSRLLEHAQWIRGLATSLARGDEDDAVQDVWLAALRSPPDADRPAKPWLAKVLQNAARKRFRDESTRQRNEAATPVQGEGTTPEEVVGRAEVHRLLVEAALELEEPFRQTLLLRFFDGLSSEAIATRLGVPAGTVRWRLKEGLDRLRARLDAKHPGGRREWMLALAPLLFPPPGPWLTAGVALMEKKTRLALVAAVALVLSLFAGWRFGWSGGATPAVVDAGVAMNEVTARREVAETSDASAGASSRLPDVLGDALIPAAMGPSAPLAAATPTSATTPLRHPVNGRPDSADGGVRFTLDKDGIRAAMRSALPEIRECYESWLGLHPTLGGKLVVTLTIDTDDGVEGRISRIAPLDGGVGLGNRTMEGCVLASLADLRFDPPLAGPIDVTYPLFFSSDGGR